MFVFVLSRVFCSRVKYESETGSALKAGNQKHKRLNAPYKVTRDDSGQPFPISASARESEPSATERERKRLSRRESVPRVFRTIHKHKNTSRVRPNLEAARFPTKNT